MRWQFGGLSFRRGQLWRSRHVCSLCADTLRKLCVLIIVNHVPSAADVTVQANMEVTDAPFETEGVARQEATITAFICSSVELNVALTQVTILGRAASALTVTDAETAKCPPVDVVEGQASEQLHLASNTALGHPATKSRAVSTWFAYYSVQIVRTNDPQGTARLEVMYVTASGNSFYQDLGSGTSSTPITVGTS